MKYILGVDAGGTKTTVAIANENGKILGIASAGPASISVNSDKEIEQNFRDALCQAMKKAKLENVSFATACVGVAGVNSSDSHKKAQEIFEKIIPFSGKGKIVVVNDTQLILPSCSDKNYGIAVICGTGSNFYGKNKKGEEAYVGGLDYLLADEGSGYWIGREALRAVVRAQDGRGESTILKDLIFKKLNVKNTRELHDVVYGKSFGKRDISLLSVLVDEAYAQKDRVSQIILEKATGDIILSINTLTKRLNMQNDEFDLVAVGGVFRSDFPFAKKIQKQLIAKKAKLIICEKEPVEGAVKLAVANLR